MQQIDPYDRQLNYLPYRYRHRSSTKPKHKQPTSSSSRPKETKHLPQRLAWEHCRPPQQEKQNNPLALFGGSDILVEQVRLGPERQRGPEGSASSEEGDHAVSVASELQLRQTSHWREAESQYDNEQQGDDQKSSPIKKLQETSEKPHQNSPSIIAAQKEEQGCASPQKMSSIFNESDVRQIKENILNNIRQSASQQSLQQPPKELPPTPHEQPNRNELPHTTEQLPSVSLSASPQGESISFDVRFERIRAINQQYQEKEEFNRNLKRMEMMKVNKIKQIKMAQKKNQRQQGHNQHAINAPPVRHESLPPTGKMTTDVPRQTNKEIVHTQQPSHLPTTPQPRPPEQPHRELPCIQPEKQAIAHNPSINTTNSSSYARYHKQTNDPKPPHPEVLTFEKHRQRIDANQKDTSVDQSGKNTHNNKTQHRPSPFPSESPIKMGKIVLRPVKPQPPQQTAQIQAPSASPSLLPQSTNDLLSQFSKSTPNKAILQAKAARSQQKTSKTQSAHRDGPVGYGSNPQFPPSLPSSGYRNKPVHNTPAHNQTYSHNMKKKKEHAIPIASPQSEKVPSNTPNHSKDYHNDFLRIQEQPTSLLPASQHQSKPSSSSLIPHSQPNNSNNNDQQILPTVQHPPPACPLKQSDLLYLQQGIAHFLTSPPPQPHPSQPLPSHASSQAVSRVIDHSHPLQQLKSQDGQQLLKIMAGNTNNFKELSSLLIQDKSPDPHDDLSLISNQLGEIVVNSNQSEPSASPTLHHVSMSSEEANYQFQGQYYEQALGYDEEGEGEQGRRQQVVDSRLIQINEDSRVFQERLNPLQNQMRITPFFQQQLQQQQLPPPLSSRPPSSTHAAISTSTLDYRSHFHPSAAIRKYKHAKHNSEQFREKSLHSVRINHSLSTLRRNGASLEPSERVRSRLERNKMRFKTRMAEGQ